MDKPIRFSNHSIEQCLERGVTEEEVIDAIRNGAKEFAKKGRYVSKQNFQYNDYWNDSFYPIKQVAPVWVEEENELVVVTVYSYFF
jgi:hypothetical protein